MDADVTTLPRRGHGLVSVVHGWLWASLVAIVTTASPAHPAPGEPVVFMTPVSNQTGEAGHEATAVALTEAVAVLASQSGVRMVERARYAQVLAEHELTLRGVMDEAAAIRLGRLLEADRLVAGGVWLQPGEGEAAPARLRVTLQVWRIADGRLAGTAEAGAAVDELVELAESLALKLREPLAASTPPADEAKRQPHAQADLHYLRGLGYYHAGQYDLALMAFFRASDADPHHARAALHRAYCYRALDELDHMAVALRAVVRDHGATASADAARALLAADNAAQPGEAGGER